MSRDPGAGSDSGSGDEAQGPARPRPAGEPELSEEILSRLEQRIDRASQAAERLIAEAAASAIGRPPPAGWQQPPSEADRDRSRDRDREGDGGGRERQPPLFGGRLGADSAGAGEVELLLQVIGSLRERIPPELQHRLADALREVLLALRALIDWYLERSERRRSEPAEVQDIPIL